MMNGSFLGFRCSICSKEFLPDEVIYTCPKDGGNLDIQIDYKEVGKVTTINDIVNSIQFSIWRYLPLLPLHEPDFLRTPLSTVGWTPIYSLPELKNNLQLKQLWVKDDGRNPSASLKDRASAVVVMHAREIGAEVVVTASTGNAGAALAGMAAASGHQSVIIVPKTAPSAKIAQLLVYGSRVLLVDGNYDQAFDLTIEAAREFGWYCRNTGYNPFTLEGKKTASFEIWEQVILPNPIKNPLCIFVPVGDGNIISAIHKGFKDLEELGWLEQMPRIFGVQAEGSAAIANAYYQGTESISAVKACTIADSISVDLPRDGIRAVRAVRQTNGQYLIVTDDEILESIAVLGKTGVFVEPAAAASLAGLKKAISKGLISESDPVLLLLTGNGLKDIHAATRAVKEAPIIQPTLEALKRLV